MDDNHSDAGSTTREAGEGVVAEALAPFVRHWQPWMDATDASDDGSYNYPDDAPMSCFARVTYGDIRRARALLTPPSDAGSTTRKGGEEATREAVIAQLVEEGRAKHRVLNDEQQGAADTEARAFYRKVIDRYRAALATTSSPDASPDSGRNDA